jgi:hypothetical protein
LFEIVLVVLAGWAEVNGTGQTSGGWPWVSHSSDIDGTLLIEEIQTITIAKWKGLTWPDKTHREMKTLDVVMYFLNG